MLSAPHCALAGVFCNWAATSVPTALASLVLTGSQPVVEYPGWKRPSPGSGAIALLTTCQSGARSTVEADATGAGNAHSTAAASTARSVGLDILLLPLESVAIRKDAFRTRPTRPQDRRSGTSIR